MELMLIPIMRDGAHTAESIENLYSERNLQVLPWSVNSSVLYAIENVWNGLKQIVLYSSPNIEDPWRNNPDLKTLAASNINSMPRRIAAMIKAKSGLTKY